MSDELFAAAGVDPADVAERVREMWLEYVGASGGGPLTLREVARRFRVPAARVADLFHESGLPVRGQGHSGELRPAGLVAAGPDPSLARREAERRAARVEAEREREQRRAQRKAAARERARVMHSHYLATGSLGAVAERYGITSGRVSQIFSAAGLPVAPGRPRPAKRR